MSKQVLRSLSFGWKFIFLLHNIDYITHLLTDCFTIFFIMANEPSAKKMFWGEEDMEILHQIVSSMRSKSGQSMTSLLENKKTKNIWYFHEVGAIW